MSIPVTNLKGYAKCFYCLDNNGEFESQECLNCFNNPLLKNNFKPNAEYLEGDEEP